MGRCLACKLLCNSEQSYCPSNINFNINVKRVLLVHVCRAASSTFWCLDVLSTLVAIPSCSDFSILDSARHVATAVRQGGRAIAEDISRGMLDLISKVWGAPYLWIRSASSIPNYAQLPARGDGPTLECVRYALLLC